MSSIEEDLRKAMNKAPFASPFTETYDSDTDSLEALHDLILGIESGVYAYFNKSGPIDVEINDQAQFSIEILNPGDVVIPLADITPGTYQIDRIADGTLTNIVVATGATAANGRIYCEYKFLTASWEPGDLFLITFSGSSALVGTTTTDFPDGRLYGRIVRDETISDHIGTPTVDQADVVTMLGNPDTAGRTLYGNLGDFMARDISPDKTLLDVLGLPNTDTGSLYERLGAYTTTASLKDALDTLEDHVDYEGAVSLADKLTKVRADYLDYLDSDLKYLLTTEVPFPTVNSFAAYVVSGGVGLGSTLANSKSIIDALGHTGLALLDSGIGAELRRGTGTQIPDNKGIYDFLKYIHDIAIGTAGVPPAPTAFSIADILQVSGTEKIKDFITTTGGSVLPATSSLYDAIGKDLERVNDPTSIMGLLGVPDVAPAARTLYGNLGDFMARAVSPETTLLAVLGIPDDANGSLYTRLGAFTSTQNLKAVLGAFTATENLKDILGNLTTTKNLGGILGDFTTTLNLKDILGTFTPTENLKEAVDPIKDGSTYTCGFVAESIADYIRTLGRNIADDKFDSDLVTANEDGSILERLEFIQSLIDDDVPTTTHIITVAHGTNETPVLTFTANRVGRIAVELDLNELVAAAEGGTGTVRLKHAIDDTTPRTIDIAQFIVGVDEVHPTVSGWVDTTASGVEVTIELTAAVTLPRTIPYKIIEAS